MRDAEVEVIVVDRANHHTFQPLLYQVATAGLSAPQIASPIRHILRSQRNARVLLGDAASIDIAAKRVVLADGEIDFDYLIVAAGLTHSYFGNSAWAQHAPGLKTLDDAFEIRRRILIAFERAERESDPAKRAAWLTFVVIGGGPTGVELAGTLAEIARHTLTGEFRSIDPAKASVLLLEGGVRILNTYPEALSANAVRQLQRLGVEVRVGAHVNGVDDAGVSMTAGERKSERISARTVLWAAGVQAAALAQSLPGPRDRMGRMLVTPTLQLPDADSIFVIGDLALVTQDDKPVPGVAYAAKQMGAYVAHAIAERVRGGGIDDKPCSVSLSRSRFARDNRAQGRCRSVSRRDSSIRTSRMVGMAPGAHFFPDRFSQSHHDHGRLDAGVHHASEACASDICGYGNA